MRTRVRSKVAAAALALGAGGMLAALTPAGPAVAVDSPPLVLDVEVDSPASLLARGLAVSLPVEVTCTSSPDSTSVSVTISQRVGNQIVRGYGYFRPDCTGQPEKLFVVAQVYDSGKVFTHGSALATASIWGCTADWWTCGNDEDTEAISVRR